MRTLFEHSWNPASRHWLGTFNELGQEAQTLTPPEREALMNEINAAIEKVPGLENIISYSNDYDPNLQRALGIDSSRFWALNNSIAPLYQTVKDVLDRLYEPEPALWTTPTASESAAVKQWITGITEMTRIYDAHKNLPLVLPANIPAPPGFTKTSQAAASQTITVRPAQPDPTGTVKTATSRLLTPTNIIIGVSAIAAVGILTIALFKKS